MLGTKFVGEAPRRRDIGERDQGLDLTRGKIGIVGRSGAALAVERQCGLHASKTALGVGNGLDHVNGLLARRQRVVKRDSLGIAAGPARNDNTVSGDAEIVGRLGGKTIEHYESAGRIAGARLPNRLVMLVRERGLALRRERRMEAGPCKRRDQA